MYVHNPFVQKEAMKHINAPEKWTEEQLEVLMRKGGGEGRGLKWNL